MGNWSQIAKGIFECELAKDFRLYLLERNLLKV